jgi:hypothetical protein
VAEGATLVRVGHGDLRRRTQDAVFVTADERFERRARAEGRVLLLRDGQFRYMPR